MDAKQFDTPVALFVFNRPGTTRRVFEAIAERQPAKLLLIADGPRSDRPLEAKACQEVRDIVSHVDWPCEVLTDFADRNLGCQERIISGLNWVFSHVEEAIILEDDCLPDLSFFPFCQELLERYRSDSRIAYISGANLVGQYLKTDDSYFFSDIGGIWGWATWRSEWQRYDRYLADWPEMKRKSLLSNVFDQPKAVAYLTQIFDSMYDATGPNTWDYQWLFTCLKNRAVVAVPSVNLISNIGFGSDATHTIHEDARFMRPLNPMKFPLNHPHCLIPLRDADRHRLHDMMSTPIVQRISRKMRRIIRPLLSHSG